MSHSPIPWADNRFTYSINQNVNFDLGAIGSAVRLWESVADLAFTAAPAGTPTELVIVDLAELQTAFNQPGDYAALSVTITDDSGAGIISYIGLDQSRIFSFSLERVVAHEIGHAFGFVDEPDADPHETIYSYRAAQDVHLGAQDIRAAQLYFGPSPRDDSIELGDAGDTVSGGLGDDSMRGHGSGDLLYGNLGSDTLSGGSDIDTLYGGQSVDDLIGGDGDDLLYGNLQDDRLKGGTGDDVLYGGQGSDALSGGDGGDLLYGNLQDDRLEGGAGDDVLYGGQGSDTLSGGGGSDTLFGGEGADLFYLGTGDIVGDFDADKGDQVIDISGQVRLAATPPVWPGEWLM